MAHAVAGVGFVASPVLGRADKALAGTLTVIVAGDPTSVAKVRPIHEVMGSKVVAVGTAPEAANLIKVASNFMMAAAIESLGEAFALVAQGRPSTRRSSTRSPRTSSRGRSTAATAG